jgi:hypothetical protein
MLLQKGGLKVENQNIIISGIVGGAVAAILNSVPFLNFINCFCCLGIMLGGAISILYYDRNFGDGQYLNIAVAITLGIASGIIGAFFSLLIEWIIYANFGRWELEFLQKFVENIEELPEYLEELLFELDQEWNSGFLWGAILLQNLILLPIFCLVGALISRVILNKNRIDSLA